MVKTKNLGKKIIVLIMALTMIFTVGLLGACDPNPTLQQQTDAVGQQVYYWQNGGNATLDELEAALKQVTYLQGRVAQLEGENEALLKQLAELQRKLEDMKNGQQQQEGFVLTISVENATLPQGQDFAVSVKLRNNYEQNKEIRYTRLFLPHISDWCLFGGNPPGTPIAVRSRLFEANSVFIIDLDLDQFGDLYLDQNEWFIGDLKLGTHELTFSATFWLQDGQPIEIKSNTVVLTVQ